MLLTDLDRVLSHREEIAVTKRVVANMATPTRQELDRNFLDSLETCPMSTPVPMRDCPFIAQPKSRKHADNSCNSPRPLIFTKAKVKINPERYRKMEELTKR